MTVTVRIPDELYAAIKAAADRRGLSLSAFLRMAGAMLTDYKEAA